MLVTIGTYEICNGTLAGGVAVGQARYAIDRVIETVVPIGALNPVLFDRTARKISFSFTVVRTFADAETAEEFILALDAAIPSTGTVTLSPTGAGTPSTIPNGAVINHISTQTGATVTTSYTIVGGQPT